jgi:hypothetical protein
MAGHLTMAREHPVSIRIYERHIKLFRFLNDTWIVTTILRSFLEERSQELLNSDRKGKRYYPVPKRDRTVKSRRSDHDVGTVLKSQHERDVFATNIISIVSRMEAFLQECLTAAIIVHPAKLAILDKTGVPLDLFLEIGDREALLERLIEARCQELMFAKPAEYIAKFEKVIAIELPAELVAEYLEVKATRDLLVHNQGRINDIYVAKSGANARGVSGDVLEIDSDYFEQVVTTAKSLSGAIQRLTEKKYK